MMTAVIMTVVVMPAVYSTTITAVTTPMSVGKGSACRR